MQFGSENGTNFQVLISNISCMGNQLPKEAKPHRSDMGLDSGKLPTFLFLCNGITSRSEWSMTEERCL